MCILKIFTCRFKTMPGHYIHWHFLNLSRRKRERNSKVLIIRSLINNIWWIEGIGEEVLHDSALWLETCHWMKCISCTTLCCGTTDPLHWAKHPSPLVPPVDKEGQREICSPRACEAHSYEPGHSWTGSGPSSPGSPCLSRPALRASGDTSPTFPAYLDPPLRSPRQVWYVGKSLYSSFTYTCLLWMSLSKLVLMWKHRVPEIPWVLCLHMGPVQAFHTHKHTCEDCGVSP